MGQHFPFLLFAVPAVFATAAAQAPVAPTPAIPDAAVNVSSLFTGRSARREQYKDVKVVAAARAGVAWLLAHQDKDGKWDCAEFHKHDPKDDPGSGAGDAQYNVGVTALSLLAVLAQGDPQHAERAHKAADWLVGTLDPESGRVANAAGDRFLYSHVLLTLALTEMSALHGNARHRIAAEAALHYLGRHLPRRATPQG